MKFLVDAQLPRRLARQLADLGHHALHTLDLPAGNRTPDMDILQLARRDAEFHAKARLPCRCSSV